MKSIRNLGWIIFFVGTVISYGSSYLFSDTNVIYVVKYCGVLIWLIGAVLIFIYLNKRT